MKRLLLFAVGIMVVFAACQKEELSNLGGASLQTISVSVPQADVATRAAGDGTQINRCILEIYCGGVRYGDRHVVALTGNKATFRNLRLLVSHKYDFVFWADKATPDGQGGFTDLRYATDDLSAIRVKGDYTGNEEGFDAFAHCVEDFEVSDAFALNVTLKRPFGQLNVKTLDWQAVASAGVAPTEVRVEFKSVATVFNALTGEAGDNRPLSYTAALPAGTTGNLTVDYIFASEAEGATLTDFKMIFLKDGVAIAENDAFTNIPLRRNYKTNVSGNLLTKQGKVDVLVDADFEQPDEEVEIREVTTVDDIEQAIQNGASDIVVATPPTAHSHIKIPHTLPEGQAADRVSITIPETEHDLIISYTDEQTGEAPDEIELFVETTGTLTVNMSGVDSQAEKTLIVGEGSSIGELAVTACNVEVYGTVGRMASKPRGTTVTLHVLTAERLAAFAGELADGVNFYDKVVIENDIDFKGAAFKIVQAANLEFDGQGHKVSNFSVENTQTAGFVCNAVSVTFRNLILENVTVTAVDDGQGNAYAGVFVGRSYGTVVVDKCEARNSTVKGINKVGGVIGFVAENHIEAIGTKVAGCTVSNVDVPEESGQIGGFAGYLGNLYGSTCSFSNCTVENTTIRAYMNRADRTISKFIGCFQGDQAADIVSIDRCSAVDVALDGMNGMAQGFVPVYGDLLGGQRYGKGTVKMTNCENVVYISNRMQLAQLATLVNAGNSFAKMTVKLTADIDLENVEWTPIGKSGKAFQGTFDGCGYTISNLYIERGINTSAANADMGLFGFTSDGKIMNFTLRNASVKGGLDVGAFAGTPHTSAYSNIMLTGDVKVEGYSYVGGMFGKNVYKSINNLTIDANEGSYVKAESETFRTYVGGVIGFMGEGNITVSNVESNIDVTGSTCDVGGITGIAHYGNTFENCLCTGDVTLVNANDAGDQLEIGGIAGVWMNSAAGKVTLRNCNFTGTLKSALNGVDKSEEVAGNRLTGRKYAPDSNDGELVIE